MKKNLFLSTILFAALFSACKKKEDIAPSTTANGTTNTLTYLIYKDSTISTDTNQTVEIKNYFYNANKKLIKVEYTYLPDVTYSAFDTLIYNAGGQLIKTDYYLVGDQTPYLTHTFSYNSGGQLTKIVALSETIYNGVSSLGEIDYTYGYTAGKISSINIVDTASTNETITNIVYSGENVSTFKDNNIPFTATTEATATNPYFGLLIIPTDVLSMTNKNNLLKLYMSTSPSKLYSDFSYTYADGRVATKKETIWENSVTPAVIQRTNTTTIFYKQF
jgi:hypothetical protein